MAGHCTALGQPRRRRNRLAAGYVSQYLPVKNGTVLLVPVL